MVESLAWPQGMDIDYKFDLPKKFGLYLTQSIASFPQ